MPTVGWVLTLGLVFASPSDAAQSCTPPTDLEQALEHAGAPAVVSGKRATLRLSDVERRPSTLDVSVRLKVLSEAGKQLGQVSIGHGAGVELEFFEGCTWRASGDAVPLPADAVFAERAGSRAITKAAFPAVEVGSVIEYRFRLAWTSNLYLEPWYFDEAVPTVLSELIYHEPLGLRLEHHLRETGVARYQVDEIEVADTPRGGRTVRIRIENLPALVEEPYGFDRADLAHRALVVPRERIRDDGTVAPMLDDWSTVVATAWRGYAAAQRFGGAVRRTTRGTVRGVTTQADRVALLLDRVRAQVPEIVPGTIFVDPKAALDRVLQAHRGTYAEVALLLHTMLEEADIASQLVWVADWRDGFPDLDVVNPGWFVKTLVRARVDGEPVFLDPGDPRLPVGRLAPTQEGTHALVADPEGVEVVLLPHTPGAGSRRTAKLQLSVADDGRVSGAGRLRLTGHHAWFYLGRSDDPRQRWHAWLESRFEEYAIGDVDVSTSVERQEIDIAWTMDQHLATVLGDEASVLPARPLGPTIQRFTLAPEARRTPVQVSFADRDEVEIEITWPVGWVLDLAPESLEHRGPVGVATVTTTIDEGAHRAQYRRTFAIDRTVFFPPEDYAALQELYAEMERHDAQSFVLVATP